MQQYQYASSPVSFAVNVYSHFVIIFGVKVLLHTGFGSGVITIGVKVCTPVKPMLAEPCRSVEFAFKRFPRGIFAEVKYDGERVQLHKRGNEFFFYSRSLKPVLAHKVNHFREFIPKAFPSGESLIIDGEILLVNRDTEKILPFGTLGVHKKAQFCEASVCFFVFDCLFYNGKSLLDESLTKRREVLTSQITVIKHHVQLSEMERIQSPARLKAKIEDAINKGLEGLVLKDPFGSYKPGEQSVLVFSGEGSFFYICPKILCNKFQRSRVTFSLLLGKRHWLKVKKDYLEDGMMADSADLVVLGAYFGTGNKGGIMSIFLMGCYNPSTGRWVTVTKVHGGHDDATLERLQKELKMKKISKNVELIPSWLDVKPQLVPDFVAEDPLMSQVWEISGAEFSKAEAHTANGISIRFPRVARIRTDKSPENATTLRELIQLFDTSKTQVLKLNENVEDEDSVDWGVQSQFNEQDNKSRVDLSERKNLDLDNGDNEFLEKSSSKIKKESVSPIKKILQCDTEDVSREQAIQQIKGRNDRQLPVCDLPKVFSGVVVEKFSSDFKFYEDLIRYFIAYDGKIDKKGVTHTIGTEKGTVRIEWIWESIKRRTRLDIAKFVN
ncbi:DNA ligase 3-like [Tropilaelaps mercedesae]|uniref:DNA ligase 3 n=1 Tax=Tropilaelaps mercedesae TaxID=418985 RepID=A0A1V9XU95_9ACAR|nr:DNA ligase 3-like [Tropilaelaps mercedesae]